MPLRSFSLSATPFWVAIVLLGLTMATPWSMPPAEAKKKQKEIRLVVDPEIQALISNLSKPLARAAGFASGRVQFHVILDSEINAFALPNQHIVLHSGLLLKADSYGEIAGVLAHELGHLAAWHHIKLRADFRTAAVQALIGSVAGIAVGLAGGGDAAGAFMLGGNALSRQQLLTAMRQKERQADQLAVDYMMRAGFAPEGVSDFFRKLHKLQRFSSLPPPYLVSHPMGLERLQTTQDYITQRRQGEIMPEVVWKPKQQQALARIRAKLEAGTAKDPHTYIQEARYQLSHHFPDPHEKFALRYGIALAQYYAGQLAEAKRGMERLLKASPNDPFILREVGLILLDQDRPADAEQSFRTALAHHDSHPDLHYRLAFALKEQNKLAAAARRLYRMNKTFPNQVKGLYLLGVVEGKRGNLAQSHLALARYEERMLRFKRAKWHLKEALKKLPKAHSLRHLIKQRQQGIAEMEEERKKLQ
uniref:Putative TPR repeat-containing protein. Peptidase M48, Ste24p n=1 Tax=Magnetococcus massalia (strain MO-1) TaxID=451514 RepID=A0A1S7LNI2_MAGMO|nr:putative TPR repeat-containing protein. Peptidase M48, Ste24p [Candidatus Magnetococcus massalia]